MSNLSPICYGVVTLEGNISSGTGNFSVKHPTVGIYEISIHGEAYSTPLYPTVVTVIKGEKVPSSPVPEIYSANITTNLPNTLTVHIKGHSYYVDSFFSFVVYKP